MQPYIVALTGGIASGKSTVEKLFRKLNVPVVDADLLAREVVAKGSPALALIAEHFGAAILNSDGTLNRQKLKAIVFQQPDELRWLEELLHPRIAQLTAKRFAEIQAPYLLWVVPLLIEKKLYTQADRVLLVSASATIRQQRLQKRDNIAEELAQNMLLSQTTEKERLAHADDIIDNSGAPELLVPQVAKLHQHYLQLAAKQQNYE